MLLLFHLALSYFVLQAAPRDHDGERLNYPFITLDNIKKRVDAWTDHTYIDNVIIVLNINMAM